MKSVLAKFRARKSQAELKAGTGVFMKRYGTMEKSKEAAMSDAREPERSREFERDPNLSGNRYIEIPSGGNSSSGWIVAGAIAVVLLGLAAYGYRGTQTTSSAPPATVGQGTHPPVPTTPLTTPVAPAPQPQ
jgi:hypothetical protein